MTAGAIVRLVGERLDAVDHHEDDPVEARVFHLAPRGVILVEQLR